MAYFFLKAIGRSRLITPPVVRRAASIMYTREWLEKEFSDSEILVLSDYDPVIRDGQAHNGMSALIDLVARKPDVV